jgi:glyoxylate/hydroxypyruvate reductase A
LLASLPNLRLISSFGAGIEHILADPSLPPRVPVTRIVEESLTRGMSEYVALHVLRHHRKLDLIQANQRAGIWKWFPPADTPRTNVGFMGLGALGAAAAQQVAQLGFPVLGWSNSEKELAGVESFVGENQRDDFLRLCHILVCLLPLTPKTRGILNRDTMRVLPQGAYVINAGRGGHLVEADLLELLDEGHLSGATLDVFAAEPPPPEHPFWRHPKVLMTPHNAADSLPEAVAPQIIDNIRRAMSGRPLLNEVDRARGY